MRYYQFAIKGNENKIKEILKSKEYLYEYRWQNVLSAINSYMYHNLKNNLGFLAYRHEADNKILATLFFDERKETLEEELLLVLENLEM